MNNNYWRKRMGVLEKERFQDAQELYQDIQEQYRRALNDVQQDIEIWYQRLADNNDISYAAAKKLLKKDELKEFKWTVEQYIKAGKESDVNGKWIKELENASAKYHISRLEALKLQMQQHAELLSAQIEGDMTEYLHKTYGEQYYRTAYEIAVGTGVGSNLTQLNTKTIETVLAKPWARDGKVFSDRIWDNKDKLVRNLHTELTQCIIRGETPKKAIDRLAKAMDVSRNQAGNLIMTETPAISAEAQEHCYKELGVEEFMVVETLDQKTCEICRDMDGRHYPMSDYRIGETAPPFHPRCRGCTCPYYDDEFMKGGQRAARDENGEIYYVPADMSYKEWKETYVSGEQTTLEDLNTELNDEEKGAIIKYVSPDAYVLNDKMRRKVSLTEAEKQWVENINSALHKLPKYKGNLNRSVMFYSMDDAKAFYNEFMVGGEYIPGQFFSTTKGGVYNEDAPMQIYIQDTKNGRDLGELAIEKEVLYTADSKFIIVDKQEWNGKYWILLEEL